MFACPATEDFFRARIDHRINLRHPLAVLASRIPRQEIEARVAQVFSRKSRVGVVMPALDLFGEQVQHAAVPSNSGRLRVLQRIMIALLCSQFGAISFTPAKSPPKTKVLSGWRLFGALPQRITCTLIT